VTTWDEDVQMWRVEVVNQHGDDNAGIYL